jgi:hypothetical protein
MMLSAKFAKKGRSRSWASILAVLAYITNQLLHSHRAIDRGNHLQPQQEGLILDFSDWPEPEDGSGIRGPACYRRAVLAGVAPSEPARDGAPR